MDVPDSNPPTRPVGAPSPLRRGLDTLRVKLFLAIAGAHLVLVAATYLIYSSMFDKGLVDYVNQSERARLTPIISQLADGYRDNGDWNWVTQDREQWFNLLREFLGWRVGPRPGGGPGMDGAGRGEAGNENKRGVGEVHPENFKHLPQGERVPRPFDDTGPLPPLTIDWRMVLFDADGKAILNPSNDPQDAESAVKLPINVDGRTVGYLGYVPRLRVLQSLESITARRQSQSFAVVGIGMLAAMLLNAALISSWLARRLRALGHGATALARGDYATRIPARGHDELARLAGDFNHLAQALEAAQRGRQQWIADIAHELRTPLTTLRAELEAVQDGVRPLSQESISSVAQEVQRLTRLVEDLRLLSLSDLGALTYRKEPVALAEAITDQLATGRAAINDRRLDVQLQLDEQVVVEADGDRLAQVFANLLQNTLRYSEAPARLLVRVSKDGHEARIDWEDSSPGVNDADLGRLTDRLFRVDSSRSSASGGSGLGLAIVHAIVTGHGGRMQPGHSALGGLHWRIWLPLAEKAAA
jgi:two-component system, OmpR family, sensor histidine kinase BaeS